MVTFSLQRVTFVVTYERISDCACDRLTENCSQRRWGGCGGHHWFGKHFWNQASSDRRSVFQQRMAPLDQGMNGCLKILSCLKALPGDLGIGLVVQSCLSLRALDFWMRAFTPTYLPTYLPACILQWFPCLFRCSAAACWKKSDRLGTQMVGYVQISRAPPRADAPQESLGMRKMRGPNLRTLPTNFTG